MTRRWNILPLLGGLLALVGCASPEVNPSRPAAGVGYVDFLPVDPEPLYLEVARFDSKRGKFTTDYSRLAPLPQGVLRLSSAPGPQRYRVFVLNRPTMGPVTCDVEVVEAKVTPVQLAFRVAGDVLTEQRDVRIGGTFFGRFGRGTRLTVDESQIFDLKLTPSAPQPFHAKPKPPV